VKCKDQCAPGNIICCWSSCCIPGNGDLLPEDRAGCGRHSTGSGGTWSSWCRWDLPLPLLQNDGLPLAAELCEKDNLHAMVRHGEPRLHSGLELLKWRRVASFNDERWPVVISSTLGYGAATRVAFDDISSCSVSGGPHRSPSVLCTSSNKEEYELLVELGMQSLM
jgi:hypothetical protein